MTARDYPYAIVLFFSSGSWLGRLIRRVTRSQYSHVGIWVDDVLYEALGSGIRRLDGAAAIERAAEAVDEVDLRVSVVDRGRVRAYLDAHVGNGYSVLGFLAAGLDALTGWRLVIALDGEHICSGLVATALTRAGYEPPQDPRLMTPGDIWDWLGGDV